MDTHAETQYLLLRCNRALRNSILLNGTQILAKTPHICVGSHCHKCAFTCTQLH